MTSAATTDPAPASTLGRVMRGTFWLALKTPLAVIIALWQVPLTQRYIGFAANDAYVFAWGFGFIQFVLEFGMASAIQKQMADAWARGDRAGVDRVIACGMGFYAVVSAIQMAALLAIAHGGLLPLKYRGNSLVIGLLWVQTLTTPFFGISSVVGGVLQAAHRYSFIPRLELLIIVLRFGLLCAGYWSGAPFLAVVAAQSVVQIGLSLGPATWVMVRDLGYRPHFGGVRLADFAGIFQVSVYMAMLQWSVVLADKVDTVVLGYALPAVGSDSLITVYQNVSKPFFQIRQTGWTLSYLVLPAVVSLAATRDRESLERIKYDGTRILVGLLTPVALLAGIYAAPFLTLWVGPEFTSRAPLLRLFLVAALPLVLTVIVQMAIGMGRVRLIAVSALAGSLVNLPLSYYLTLRLGVSGVIWGTVLTTLFSNLLIPGIYAFRVLDVDFGTFLARALGPPMAGALALLAACWAFGSAVPPDPIDAPGPARAVPFLANLAVGSLAYAAGYFAPRWGRGDLAAVARKARGFGRGCAAVGRRVLRRPALGG